VVQSSQDAPEPPATEEQCISDLVHSSPRSAVPEPPPTEEQCISDLVDSSPRSAVPEPPPTEEQCISDLVHSIPRSAVPEPPPTEEQCIGDLVDSFPRSAAIEPPPTEEQCISDLVHSSPRSAVPELLIQNNPLIASYVVNHSYGSSSDGQRCCLAFQQQSTSADNSMITAGHDAELANQQFVVSMSHVAESSTSAVQTSCAEGFVTLDASLIYSSPQLYCQALSPTAVVIPFTALEPPEIESVILNDVVLNATSQSDSAELLSVVNDTPSVSQLCASGTALPPAQVPARKYVKKTAKRSAANKITEQQTPVSRKRKADQASKRKATLRTSDVEPYIREIPDHSDDSALSNSDDDDDERRGIIARHKSQTVAKDAAQPVEKMTQKAKVPRLTWLDQEIAREPDSVKFTGNTRTNQPAIEQLRLPADFFQYFFSDELLDQIVEQTILYSVQKRPSKPLQCTRGDLKRFIGVLLYMSLVRMPSSRSYWSADFRMDKVVNALTVNRFEEIKRFLHFSDNTEDVDAQDRLYKVRPVVTALRHKCQLLQMDESLSLDEQIIPFKGRSGLKQYIPKKPHKWGYKMFVLSSTSGFSYDFEFYTGKNDNHLKPGEPDCGASGNVVIRLTRIVPSNKNHKLYFDNYFTSPALQLHLASRGIHSLGTVRLNRIPQCNVPSEKTMKQKGRGTFVEKSTTVGATSLSLVSWYDNRIVNFLSTFVGSLPSTEVRRWSKADGAFMQVPCPNIVQVYNRHMGGVDLLDSLIGLYRSRLRSKKWYLRIFFHLIDMMVVNAWILYRDCCTRSGEQKSMRLRDFKADIAAVFCNTDLEVRPNKKGRRSRNDGSPPTKYRRCAPRPQEHLRTDGNQHWPEWSERRGRCRLAGCKGSTRVRCSKCKIFVCFTPKQNCFRLFHNS